MPAAFLGLTLVSGFYVSRLCGCAVSGFWVSMAAAFQVSGLNGYAVSSFRFEWLRRFRFQVSLATPFSSFLVSVADAVSMPAAFLGLRFLGLNG